MSLYKRSNLSLSLPPHANNLHLTDRPEKNQFSMNKKGMNDQRPTGSSVTDTMPSSIKQNEYHFKNLTNLDSLKVPLVRDPQANTDLSLQFCSKGVGEAAGSKYLLNNLHIQELLLPECLEDANQNGSLHAMKSPSCRGRTVAGFNNETQKKPKTVTPREQDVSDCSAMDFFCGMSCNDLARVIGDKRFWKMRTYMINQQKIFAAQVFELHRLIMVQKMVAKSPKLVKLNSSKRGTMAENHKPVTEEYPEHMKPKLPISKELVTSMWSKQLLPAPGNQWLVPVMSASEGLLYKPYAGPCPPPSSAFMVPIYGQDSLDTAFKFPVSSQFSHSYFPPNPFDQFQRWSSTSSHLTQAIPFSLKKSLESNDSEVHGSTASSPPEKHKLDVLPLFPTEPTHHTDEYKQKQKPMLPHNPTSASESAARKEGLRSYD